MPRDELDRAVGSAGGQGVLDCVPGMAVALIPRAGLLVQVRSEFGFAPGQLFLQRLPDEVVVAVPGPDPVQRDEEQVRSFQTVEQVR